MYHHITQNNFLSEEEPCDIPKKTPQFTSKPLEITDKATQCIQNWKNLYFQLSSKAKWINIILILTAHYKKFPAMGRKSTKPFRTCFTLAQAKTEAKKMPEDFRGVTTTFKRKSEKRKLRNLHLPIACNRQDPDQTTLRQTTSKHPVTPIFTAEWLCATTCNSRYDLAAKHKEVWKEPRLLHFSSPLKTYLILHENWPGLLKNINAMKDKTRELFYIKGDF